MTKRRFFGWVGLATGLAAVVALGVWLRVVYFGTPVGLMRDIRAGLAARPLKDPDARLHKYLEGRYGPMSEATNRERVFVDFFNPERIKTLQFLVQHAPEEQRQANIDAMSRWLAGYRAGLTSAERAALNARFQQPEGRALLSRATAQYNAQDVHYRGQTAPVISELLRTLNEVEQSP
jgi:hypothetical protein